MNANPGVEKEYALDFLSVVRHVATVLDGAAPAALSVADMAKGYRHPVPTDLSRVRMHHGIDNDTDAVRFLVARAVAALKDQVESNGDGSYRLAVEFDKLRYERRKVHRLVESDDKDDERVLRGVYNDMINEQVFYVTVEGARGGRQDGQFRLHPLARAIPQISEKEFLELAADIGRNGIELPIVVYDGQVLDGRHRLAIASALDVPVKVTEVDGDEARAKARVLSLNVTRRHLTSAQRASIVRQLFLPEAKAKAKERQVRAGKEHGRSQDRLAQNCANLSESAKAAEAAVKESGSLATVRAVEDLAPLDDAPNTQKRVDRGEIKTVATARREALKEQGRDPDEKAPVVQPRSAWDRLGCALGDVKAACEAIEDGRKGTVTKDKIRERVDEIRGHLDRVVTLIHGERTGHDRSCR